MASRWKVVLVGLLLLAGALLGGCAAAPARTGGGEDVAQTVSLPLSSEPQTLDSARAADPDSFMVLGNAMEGLLRFDSQGALVPGVAAGWQVEQNGMVYTFRLREDARWSDGSPVTAADFRTAWLRALDPLTGGSNAYLLYYIRGAEALNTLDPDAPDFSARREELRGQVAVEAVDDRTLRVTLTRPASQWLSLAALPTYAPVPAAVVEAQGDSYGSEITGMLFNGPFAAEAWEHGRSVVLVKNSHYWDAASVRLERATLLIVHDNRTALDLFANGQLDRAPLPAGALSQYRQDRRLTRTADAATWFLACNLAHPALRAQSLRSALSQAVDRAALADQVLAGNAVPAGGLIPPTIAALSGEPFRAVAGSHLQAKADRTAAERAWVRGLKEAGLSTLYLRLVTLRSDMALRAARAVQSQLEQSLPGLKVEVVALDQRALLEQIRAGAFDLALSGTGGDYDDAMTFLEVWRAGSPLNTTGWSHAAYDEAVRQGEAATDREARVAAMVRAEEILLTDLPVIPLFHPASAWLTAPRLQGLVAHSLGAEASLKDVHVIQPR
jgi:oligopeptide transport system substrate-binding protein